MHIKLSMKFTASYGTQKTIPFSKSWIYVHLWMNIESHRHIVLSCINPVLLRQLKVFHNTFETCFS